MDLDYSFSSTFVREQLFFRAFFIKVANKTFKINILIYNLLIFSEEKIICYVEHLIAEYAL